MLPNFFVAGCQKCATTSLHHYLKQHPQIFLPEQKETKHFVIDERYEKGMDYYSSTYFSNVSGQSAVGEVDPDYIYFPNALKRICKHFDITKTKIIFIFRNPIERAYSHYLMTYRRGIETETFSDALDCENERINSGFFSKMHYSYRDRGYYHRQLQPFLEAANTDNLMFLLSEDLKYDAEKTLIKCFEFLNVDAELCGIDFSTLYHKKRFPRSSFLLNEIVRKKDTLPKKFVRAILPYKRLRHALRGKIISLNETSIVSNSMQMNDREKSRLLAEYSDENWKFADLIKRDLSHWNQMF